MISQVRKVHAFLRESFPDAIFLDTAIISRKILEKLEAVAAEAVVQGSWFEVGKLGDPVLFPIPIHVLSWRTMIAFLSFFSAYILSIFIVLNFIFYSLFTFFY